MLVRIRTSYVGHNSIYKFTKSTIYLLYFKAVLSMALLGVIFDIWPGIQEFGLRDDDLKPSGHELHCSL